VLILDAILQAARTWGDGTHSVPESEPYCVLCRSKVDLFAGKDGWCHYRGDALSGVEQHRATHRVITDWRSVGALR
jgi:hypothetical protein